MIESMSGLIELTKTEQRAVDGGTDTGVWQDPENPDGGCIPDPFRSAFPKIDG